MKRLLSFLAFACSCAFLLPIGCDDGGRSCDTTEDCEAGEVCRAGSPGKCLLKCNPADADPCPGTAICSTCAASSCPTCDDCVAACVDSSGGSDPGGGW